MTLTSTDIRRRYDELSAAAFVYSITDAYLEHIGGRLTPENMPMLSTQQHTLLAYRFMLDEVMEGGFIQLIQNGYAGYVLEGPFAYVVKKEWGLRELSKLLYEVKSEYHRHRDRLEQDLSDEDFMALYEELDTLNNMGDDFLDDHQEQTTPAVARYVAEHADEFVIP
jgi:hypothetical protein